METFRCVARSMGAWLWGYPRGHRIGIVKYVPGELKSGKKVWKSDGSVCRGLTARNIDYYRQRYPDAFDNPGGSLHNKEIKCLSNKKQGRENVMEQVMFDKKCSIDEVTLAFLLGKKDWPLRSILPVIDKLEGVKKLGVVHVSNMLRVYLTPNSVFLADFNDGFIDYNSFEELVADWMFD